MGPSPPVPSWGRSSAHRICRKRKDFVHRTNVARHQGDQIGRIFAQWTIVYYEQSLENYRSIPHIWATFIRWLSLVINLDKKSVWLHFRGLLHKLIWSHSSKRALNWNCCRPSIEFPRSRVTRLGEIYYFWAIVCFGEISPFGRLFALGNFLKIA
jgi:hypothetical protein